MPEGITGAELDRYLDEAACLIRRAESLQTVLEQAGAPEGHRLLAARVLLAMDRLQHGMRHHRAALEPAPAPVLTPAPAPAPVAVVVVPAAGRRPWQLWFGARA